ncbi:MAG: helix-turn-helix domain-containing protein [Candidatus Korarchaeota archaeon]|nr:helix-turn-helix domain-containing protein [Candidatus Korarchaeota archaeon]
MEEDKLFQALAHKTRRIILRSLAEEGPQTYTSLLRKTGLTTGTLNHHLEKMRGLITSNRGLYELTEDGWKAYRAMLVIEEESISATRVESPLDLVLRPFAGFRSLAELKPSFIALSLLIGLSAILSTIRYFGIPSLIGNVLSPLIFSLAGAKVGYNAEDYVRFLVSFPATLLPLLVSSLVVAQPESVAGLLGVPPYLISSAVPKVCLVWFFYLLMTSARHSLRLNPSESFVVAAVGIFAGRVVLDSVSGVSLVLG